MENFIFEIIAFSLGGMILGAIILALYQVVMKKEIVLKGNRKATLLYILCISISLFYFIGIRKYWGSDTIGSFFEKEKYVTHYYVNLFENKNTSKNYRVKADILADYREYDEGSQRVYWVKKVYFNNGGYLTFQREIDDANDHASLELNKKVNVKDDNGKEWYIELTNEKVN